MKGRQRNRFRVESILSLVNICHESPLIPGLGSKWLYPMNHFNLNLNPSLKEHYQKEDPDQAAIHLFNSRLPPRAFPLCLDQLATLEKHHGAIWIGSDIFLYEVSAGAVFYVLPCLFHYPKEKSRVEGRNMSWKGRTVGKELLDTFKVLREKKMKS